jgi:hypothetical protein
MSQSEQINELAAALAKAQGSMENAAKNKQNPHFKSKYADLAAVLDAIRAPLSVNGLSTVQTMQMADRCIILRTTLLHSSGQFVSTDYPIAMGLKPQEMGSAITYGRRYSLAALVGIAQDDDDANAAAHSAPAVEPVTAKITAAQAKELSNLCDQVEAGFEESFCNYFNIEAIADLPAYEYERATKAVNKKRSAV